MSKKSESMPIVSAARTKLARLIAARDEAAEAMTLAQAALTRLQATQAEAGPIEAEVSRLDAEETAAMTAWSRTTGEAPAPTPNAELRTALNVSLSAARAKADAARRAEPALAAEFTREAEKRAQIETWIDVAVAEILIESADPLLAEFDEANRALGAKAVRLLQVQDMIGDVARKLPERSEQGRQIYVALEEFTGAVKRTLPRAAQDDDAATVSRTAWRDLAGRLRDDAEAKLAMGV